MFRGKVKKKRDETAFSGEKKVDRGGV